MKRSRSRALATTALTGVGLCALVGILAPAAAGAAPGTTLGQLGQLDANFNPSGSVPGSLLQGGTAANAVAVVPTFPVVGTPQAGSGNIVVASFTGSSSAPASSIYEYTPTGSLVSPSPVQLPGFDAQAVAVVPNDPSASPALADAGDIVVAGWTTAATSSCANASKHTAAIEFLSANLTPLSPGVIDVDCTKTAQDQSQFNGLTIDPAGLPIAVGQALHGSVYSLLARLTTGGALDSTFGSSSSGYEETNVTASTSYASAVAVETVSSADEILTTGSAVGAASGCDFGPYVAAFGPTGTPVATFGTNGMVNVCSYNGKGTGIAVDTAPSSGAYGDVIVGGQVIDTDNAQKNALFEWDANGNPVSSFNSTGHEFNPGGVTSPSAWNGITYEPTGDFILAVGYEASNEEMAVSEFYATTGSLNPNFGTNGTTVTSFGNDSGFLNGVAMAANGAVIAVGAAPTAGNATQAYVAELYGQGLTITAGQVVATSASTEQITFIVTLSPAYPLTTDSFTTVCFTVTSGAAPQCQQVEIPAGQTSATATLTVASGPVGVGNTVTASAQNGSGIGAVSVTPAVTTVEHFTPAVTGYSMVAQNGAVYNYSAPALGRAYPSTPIVGMASTAAGDGYWLVESNGIVHAYGAAASLGLSYPVYSNNIVGIAATPDGKGIYLVNNRGAVITYGDASYSGGTNTFRNPPPVHGIVANPLGAGYWLYDSSGAVFAFGGAPYLGGTNQYHIKTPVTGMAALPGAAGYWQVTAAGSVFNYGAAPYLFANTANANAPVMGIVADPPGDGFWMAQVNGKILAYGGAPWQGGLPIGVYPATPISGFA